jgi:tetratricopeptide (TPR) repeat protein
LRLAEALQRQIRDAGRTIPDVRTAARIELALKAAAAANPYRPQAHEALYFWHRDANDPARALAAIRTGVRYNPASLELRLLLVRELERGGSLALATHHLKLAALRTTGSDQGNLMLQLAELFEQRGLRDQARRWWQYAQQVDDLSAQTQSRLRRLGERLNLLDPPVGRR